MAKPQKDMSAQRIFRMEIYKEVRLDPGTETTEIHGHFEMQSPALLNAADIRLKSIENLILTAGSTDAQALAADGHDLFASKTVYNPGRKGNQASVYLWDNSGDAQATGSHYVNFIALGE